MKKMTSVAAAALLAVSLDASAASLRFDNSAHKLSATEWQYQLGDLTATVTSQGGPLFYNGTEGAIGVGTNVFNGAIAGSETVTVQFDQPVVLSQISFRQWENPGPLGTVYDRVVLSWDDGQSITLTDSGQGVVMVDDFTLADLELTQFTLTPDHHNTAFYLWGVELETAEIPLPAAAWLFGSALLGLGVAGRRRPQEG